MERERYGKREWKEREVGVLKEWEMGEMRGSLIPR